MAPTMSDWLEVKKQIDKSKEWVDDFTGRDKTEMEKVYELANSVVDFHGTDSKLEKSACAAAITKKFIGLIKPYASVIQNALKIGR